MIKEVNMKQKTKNFMSLIRLNQFIEQNNIDSYLIVLELDGTYTLCWEV